MDCCDIQATVDPSVKGKKLVLAGNPNVGKSIFFHSFTGFYVTVSNYPGTTLDINRGTYGDYIVSDTTGVYGVSSFNDEERIARDEITAADCIVNVVDACRLERDLFLTQQIIDMGKPMILALNMMDEAEKSGMSIDLVKLEKELGIPVVPAAAIRQQGLQQVKDEVSRARRGRSSITCREELNQLAEKTGNPADALLILEGDEETAVKYQLQPLGLRESIYTERRRRVDAIVKGVVTEKPVPGKRLGSILGGLMVKPATGIPILLGILFLMYQFIGVFVAQTVVGFTEETIMIGQYEPLVRLVIARLFAEDSIFWSYLAGEFGLLTMTVTYLIGLLLPLVAGFYFFLALLEDSGVLPRIAVLTDRILTALGLNGRAVIPMILGFGCVTMATITTRLLDSKREKFIAVFLLGLTIPCSAQLGVIAGLIAPLGPVYFLAYGAIILVLYILLGTLLNKTMPGTSSDLFIDLPPLRLPRLGNVARKTGLKSYGFLKEAGLIFLIGSAVITTLELTGSLAWIEKGLRPMTETFLGLPGEASRAFLMGIVRRDFGAAGLYDLSLTPVQTLTALVVITLFVPCIAAMMVMIKERNWKQALVIWGGSWGIAFLTGGAINKVLSLW